jgi:hypothetical protein
MVGPPPLEFPKNIQRYFTLNLVSKKQQFVVIVKEAVACEKVNN